MIKIDFWYNDTLETITGASADFYPNEGIYRGNLFKDGRIVGDYVSDNSVEIEDTFPGIFGD